MNERKFKVKVTSSVVGSMLFLAIIILSSNELYKHYKEKAIGIDECIEGFSKEGKSTINKGVIWSPTLCD